MSKLKEELEGIISSRSARYIYRRYMTSGAINALELLEDYLNVQVFASKTYGEVIHADDVFAAITELKQVEARKSE